MTENPEAISCEHTSGVSATLHSFSLVSDRIPSSIGNSHWLISGCEFTAKGGSRVESLQNRVSVHNIITFKLAQRLKKPEF